MSIVSIMIKCVVCVMMDDLLDMVWYIFEVSGFYYLLVVEDDRLVGVIFDWDYLKVISLFLDLVIECICDCVMLDKCVY